MSDVIVRVTPKNMRFLAALGRNPGLSVEQLGLEDGREHIEDDEVVEILDGLIECGVVVSEDFENFYLTDHGLDLYNGFVDEYERVE